MKQVIIVMVQMMKLMPSNVQLEHSVLQELLRQKNVASVTITLTSFNKLVQYALNRTIVMIQEC